MKAPPPNASFVLATGDDAARAVVREETAAYGAKPAGLRVPGEPSIQERLSTMEEHSAAMQARVFDLELEVSRLEGRVMVKETELNAAEGRVINAYDLGKIEGKLKDLTGRR